MTYKALYRAYRPQVFDDVAGQQHVVKTLQNAIKENKIGHAYLFAGPRGTGKTTIAKLLAKALNCTGDNPPCDQCENCKSITAGQHPDVIEIDAASNNGVDEVRDLIDKVKYAPINGKYKVYIIDEVHMMSPGAFNALLKTLEEPPEHIVFILATTEPHKILPTIISRCQRFDFKRVEEKDIIDRMEYVLKEENMPYEVAALNTIAKLADGGMRDALSILEQCLAFQNNITVENVNQVYGLLSMDNKIKFIKLLLTKDIKGVLNSLDNMLSGSVDIKRLTFDIIDVLKDVVIYKNTEDVSVLFVLNQDDINSLVPYILVEEAFEMIDILIDASNHYSQSLDAKTYFELAMLKICNQVKEENKITLVNEDTVVEMEPVVKQEAQHPVIVEPEGQQTVEEVIDERPVEEVKEEIIEQPIEEVVETKEDVVSEMTEQQDQKEPVIEETQVDSIDEEIIPEEIPEEMPTSVLEDMMDNQIEETKAQELLSNPSEIEVSFDDILNIMVQAKRTVLNDVQDKWPVISRYRYNLNTAKYATMLCDAKPVVGADGGLIITFEHQPQVNDVNYSQNYHLLKNFLKEVLGDEFDFIAIKEEEWPAMRRKFIQLNQENSLPQPQPIILHHIKEYQEPKVELDEAHQNALDMFGDIVEFEE